MIRIKWALEEMVAMVDLYFRNKAGLIDDMEIEYVMLSDALIKRADSLGVKHDEKYRNINGMKMIYQNVRFVDTNGQDGLSSKSKMVKNAVTLYRTDKVRFDEILAEFQKKYMC